MGLQCHFGLLTLSHPDNSLEANPLVTPLHIVPEWDFLIQYSMLKAIPNKNTGFIVLITSITFLFLFTEVRNISSITTINQSGIFLNYVFLISLVFLYISAQFPLPIYITKVRI